MALNVRGKDRNKTPNFQTFCVLICVHVVKSLFSSRLRYTPSAPSKGDCFCLFPFCFQSQILETNPIKALFLL